MLPTVPIRLKKLGDLAQVPKRGSDLAAAWDLYLTEDVMLEPYKTVLVPTELSIAIPPETALLVLPRSGNSLKEDLFIPNAPGLIDADYRGHCYVMLRWMPNPAECLEVFSDGPGGDPSDSKPRAPYGIRINSSRGKALKAGARIAQALLIEYIGQAWEVVSELPATQRGSGGFGSTGTCTEQPSGR